MKSLQYLFNFQTNRYSVKQRFSALMMLLMTLSPIVAVSEEANVNPGINDHYLADLILKVWLKTI